MAAAAVMSHADIIVDRFELVDKKAKAAPVETSIHDSGAVANVDGAVQASVVELLRYSSELSKKDLADCLTAGWKQGKTVESMVNETDADGRSALLLAAQKRETQLVVGLVALKARDVVDPVSGWTALMHCAVDGDVTAVKAFVKVGADLNAFAKDDWSALSLAIQHSRDDVVDELLHAGASMDAIKRRHPFAHEQYLAAQREHQARVEAKTAAPFAVYVSNASEYV